MTKRPMTPEEMQDFEDNALRHEDTDPSESAATPASEPDVADTRGHGEGEAATVIRSVD